MDERISDMGDSDRKDEMKVDAAPARSRRAFLMGVGRKAAYMTPVVLTLAAAPALASPHSASCKPIAGSCDSDNDCCSGNCEGGFCAP